MKVVILCGGQGTRIRDVSDNIPKPMLPIGNLPILWHIMKFYAHWGHQDFVLCLGYKGQAIKDFFLNYQAHTSDFTITLGGKQQKVVYHNDHPEADWQVTLAETGLDSMTGARLRRARKFVADDTFMLTYGDGLSDIDLDALLKFHKSHGKVMTVTGVRPPGRFGELGSADGRVTEFNEKPQATGGRISGGYFICEQALFDYLPEGDDLIFEQEPIRALVKEGQLMVYEHDGFWQPLDTYRDYTYLNNLISAERAPWMIW